MANKHLHKYRLRNLTRDPSKPPYYVYICVKQDCSHHIRIDLVDGKLAECNRCEEPFIIKLVKIKHGDRIIVRPHCDDCTKTPDRVRRKRERISNSIDELMQSMLPKDLLSR
jgi:hypothetical protein